MVGQLLTSLFLVLEAYSHMLVFWPLEGSVTTVSTTNTSSGKEVGEECQVQLRAKQYTGTVAAKGR